ncbi:MAG TPA: FAD-dependent oxidoreductase [Longimicrobiaceae bacterium]|nr:FAD-dependent oxidoreductase [Longimicrobiaceae bacterium]
MPSVPRLLLIGCGHAHLFVLEAIASGKLPGVRPTLISLADDYYYSGMIPGVLASCYESEEARFQPPRLARAAGAEWVRGRVVRVDAAARRIHLEEGGSLAYELLSLDIGSRLTADELPGVCEHALPVKPMRRALRLGETAEEAVERASPARPARIVVVGGGAAGVEIALCLEGALARRFGRGRYALTVLEAGEQILAEYPRRLRQRAARLLGERAIEVRTACEVAEVAEGEITTAGGESLPFAALLWATGPRAPRLPRQSGLPVDEQGYLRVEPTLQVVDHPEIFGAGDCVALRGYPWVPKAGVYAVRQGPVLARNLARRLRSEELEGYEPQRHWLSLMNSGDGRALLAYRGAALHGRTAWWLKDWIDRRFMRRFRRLEA